MRPRNGEVEAAAEGRAPSLTARVCPVTRSPAGSHRTQAITLAVTVSTAKETQWNQQREKGGGGEVQEKGGASRPSSLRGDTRDTTSSPSSPVWEHVHSVADPEAQLGLKSRVLTGGGACLTDPGVRPQPLRANTGTAASHSVGMILPGHTGRGWPRDWGTQKHLCWAEYSNSSKVISPGPFLKTGLTVEPTDLSNLGLLLISSCATGKTKNWNWEGPQRQRTQMISINF